MSMYGDTNYDMNDLFDQMRKFLKDHKACELLRIVTDAVEYNEEWGTEE